MNPKRNQFGIGAKVSLFTLGTMRAIKSIEQMSEVVQEAYFAGINHIETAPVYGPAEFFLGESLRRLQSEGIYPKGGWLITSKILPGIEFSRGKDQIKQILTRLKRSKINNLAIHGLNLSEHLEWALNGEGNALLQWVKGQNLVDQVGFSSHGSFDLINTAIASRQFDFCSLHLHLLDQERIPLAKKALESGMGVMAISPADKGGHLYTPSQTLIKACAPIRPLELAYRFLLSEGISTLTLGASCSQDFELAKKLVNANTPLSKLEKNSLNRLQQITITRLSNTLCGQCRKCLPCPNEVPIPEILRLRNLAIGLDLSTYTKERYNLIGKAGHWWEAKDANSCENCGDCLPRCPNNLNIPELLQETHMKLVDKPKRRLWG